MQISVAFPSNLAMFRFCFPLLLSLPLSSSLLSSATVNENGLTYPTSLVRRKERGGGRERREATRWIEGRERRERSRADRRRSGIHFEIASHPVRSPFSTASTRIPTSSRGLFPGFFPQEKPLLLLYSPRVSRTLSGFSPFREPACSSRILISSQSPFSLKPSSHQE